MSALSAIRVLGPILLFALSVAFAGAMAGIPVRIVRGISNIAGDREKSRWRIADALHAATDLLKEQLS